ncbi:unnamed protein product [Porites evermanni]|uniref:Uncharacterized protein n=2 Tax=Porites TaxID=46719 RepID=A0ABN8NR76_9CNID|nr:unnamed protein product [Porites lobata]CAH3158766.1 unnamed protein product [Porites evermanni]
MAPKAIRKSSPSKTTFATAGAFIMDFYRNPTKWQLVKHTTIFIVAVLAAREFSDIDLMAPPPAP